MCGVAGIFHRDGRPADRSLVAGMASALAHRGPDGDGVWTDGCVGFGHRRLSVRDLSSAGRQPFADPSGQVVVTYNGEIYNDKALRAELTKDFGVVFRTHCDTEILPHGYLAWGERLFERLEGMFAVALWDQSRKELLLARDGVGIKPLFYSADEHTVRFGSEIKALLVDPEQPRWISEPGLHRFLAMGYAGPDRTTLESMHQVPPGHVLCFTAHTHHRHQFWVSRRSPTIRNIDEAAEAFQALWARVVEDQLVADVPVGVLQSGGIDSTLVSAQASRLHNPALFAAQFSDTSFDEGVNARAVADWLGKPLHTVAVDDTNLVAHALRSVVHHADGQICDEASIPLFLLCGKVRQHVTVVLSGDGGDEAFGGYATYRASQIASAIGPFFPAGLLSWMGRKASHFGAADERRLPPSAVMARLALGMGDDPASAHTRWRRLVPGYQLDTLYGPGLQPQCGTDPFAEYKAALDSTSGRLLDRCLVADQRFHLPGGLLLKADFMSMAHSLELRVPFLDRRILDFAGSCDGALLSNLLGDTKRVLRHVAKRIGVPEQVTRAPKRGFNAPLARLLRTGLRDVAGQCLDTQVALVEPYLSADAVRRMWREHRDRQFDHAYTLWPILTFALWRQQLEQSAPLRADTADASP